MSLMRMRCESLGKFSLRASVFISVKLEQSSLFVGETLDMKGLCERWSVGLWHLR